MYTDFQRIELLILVNNRTGRFTDFSFFVFVFVFSTGLVRLYIACLPVRSCQTIGAPSVQGSAQCLFFHFWLQQDSNPHTVAYHADVLPLRHFDPKIKLHADIIRSCPSNNPDKTSDYNELTKYNCIILPRFPYFE